MNKGSLTRMFFEGGYRVHRFSNPTSESVLESPRFDSDVQDVNKSPCDEFGRRQSRYVEAFVVVLYLHICASSFYYE